MLTRTKKAFTLLELVIVLIVLGLLASIAIPTFNEVKRNSALGTAEANAEAIARNAEAIASSRGADVVTVSAADLNTAIDELEGADADEDATYDVTIGSYHVDCPITLSGAAATVGTCVIGTSADADA